MIWGVYTVGMSESVQPVQCTLVFPERDGEVLLGKGKRGGTVIAFSFQLSGRRGTGGR